MPHSSFCGGGVGIKIIRAWGCCEVGDGVVSGVGVISGIGVVSGVRIPLLEEGMGQGDIGRAQSTISHGRSHRGTPKGAGSISPVSRPWVLLGWDLPPHFEVEILILAVGAPKRGEGLGPKLGAAPKSWLDDGEDLHQ